MNEEYSNFWIVGENASNNSDQSIYITDDSTNYHYNPIIRSEPYFYKQFFIPYNSSNVQLKFDLRVI